jgi:hypothetical protein
MVLGDLPNMPDMDTPPAATELAATSRHELKPRSQARQKRQLRNAAGVRIAHLTRTVRHELDRLRTSGSMRLI